MILLTGATGLIGRAIHKELRAAGLDVRTIGRSAANDIVANVAEPTLSVGVFTKQNPSVIVHCAAAVPGLRATVDNESSARLTEAMDRNVLAAAEHQHCDVVYLSGCGLYRRNSPRRLRESDTLDDQLISPYLRAKRRGDETFCSYSRGTVVRVSAPVGPGMSARSAVGIFLDAARSDREIVVWGEGKREQDYIDVSDLAILIRRCIEIPHYGPVNAASGVPTHMSVLAAIVCKQVGRGRVVISDINDPNIGQFSRFCIERAKLCFGWSPSIELSESLDRIIQTYR